ncbi:MAG: MBL fold metallo-hydrolase [Polaromonas sp.]
MYLFPIPVFTDNYFWLLLNGKRALAVDSGAAKPVLHALQQQAPQLESILVTHPHSDHTGGVDASATHDTHGTHVLAANRQWKNQFK